MNELCNNCEGHGHWGEGTQGQDHPSDSTFVLHQLQGPRFDRDCGNFKLHIVNAFFEMLKTTLLHTPPPPPAAESARGPTSRQNSAKLPKTKILGAAPIEECHATWNDICTARTALWALFCANLQNFEPAPQVG